MNLKHMLFSITALFLSSCTTSEVTGKSKLLGFIPVPSFIGPPAPPPDHPYWDKAASIEQLAPFVWCSIALMIAGVVLMKVGDLNTGLGRSFLILGVCLAAFAVVMPQIAGWLGLIAIVGVAVLTAYLLYKFIAKRKA